MKYEQRDIVEINFMFPDGTFLRKISRMRQPYFDEVVEKIKETIF